MMAKTPGANASPPRGPFHRPLRLREVSSNGVARAFDAAPAECEAIAADLGFPAVASLHADLRVTPRAGGQFDVTGKVEAVLTQVCVATLEPFESTVRQDVAIRFAPPKSAEALGSARTADIDLDAPEDDPDPIVDNAIDLGAVALEFVVLGCDPYPKKPGVHFSDVSSGEEEQDRSPFAALGRLKDPS